MSDGKIEAKMKVGQQKISDNLSMKAFVVNYPIKKKSDFKTLISTSSIKVRAANFLI